jgi:hypothetical protein
VTADDWLFWLPNIPPPDNGVVLDGDEKCQEDPSAINPGAPGSAYPSEVSSAMVHDDEKEENAKQVEQSTVKKMPASFVEQSVSGVVVRRARLFPNCYYNYYYFDVDAVDVDDVDIVDIVDFDVDVTLILMLMLR